jgi:sialidase-1
MDLFISGQGGYHTYRIPAIVATKRGVLLAICEGRKTSRSDHGDLDLIVRRSTDGGRNWGPVQLIYEEGGDQKITIGNPCPVVDRDTGVIWLPFTRDNDDVLLVLSEDDGKSWTPPRVITSSVKKDEWTWYATGPGNGIQLTRGPYRGRLMIPCDHRVRSIADRRKSTRSHVIYSDDHGETWQIGGIADFLMNECAVAELSDASLLLNMRSMRGLQRRGVATSKDGGLTWSKCANSEVLIEPNCQATMIRYTWDADGEKSRLLFCNPASEQGRNRLTVRVSYDEGRTWPVSQLLYEGSAAYSCLVALPDGDIGVLFERDDYGKITFARVSRKWLECESAE